MTGITCAGVSTPFERLALGAIAVERPRREHGGITYDSPEGVETVEVDDGKISESGKVHGVRIQREDGSYLHVPDA